MVPEANISENTTPHARGRRITEHVPVSIGLQQLEVVQPHLFSKQIKSGIRLDFHTLRAWPFGSKLLNSAADPNLCILLQLQSQSHSPVQLSGLSVALLVARPRHWLFTSHPIHSIGSTLNFPDNLQGVRIRPGTLGCPASRIKTPGMLIPANLPLVQEP
nr:hypothetical protein CFP56_13399 [Quercus suber]